MKKSILIIALMSICFVSGAQDTLKFNVNPNLFQMLKSEINENKWSMGTAFLAGFFEANREILRHDYSAFKRVWPGANDKFWNPAISWQNKWKNGDPTQGEAFFGSTTYFVALKDGIHLTGAFRNVSWVTTVTINIGGKNTWKGMLIEAGLHWISYSAGFNLTYHGLYGHPFYKAKPGQ